MANKILGHLIYKRWNPETKEAYAGKCWWTSPKQTPKKAFLKRQKDHEKNGMEGWNSEILSIEYRKDVPAMSDGMYHIRIAVNEGAAVDTIPTEKRRNKIHPLLQLNRVSSDAEMARIGGLVVAEYYREHPKEQFVKMQSMGRKGGRIGGRNGSYEDHARAGRIGGRLGGLNGSRTNRENGTAIFAPGMSAKGGRARFEKHGSPITPEGCLKGGRASGRKAVESGSMLRAQKTGNHIHWHVNRGRLKPETCSYCNTIVQLWAANLSEVI